MSYEQAFESGEYVDPLFVRAVEKFYEKYSDELLAFDQEDLTKKIIARLEQMAREGVEVRPSVPLLRAAFDDLVRLGVLRPAPEGQERPAPAKRTEPAPTETEHEDLTTKYLHFTETNPTRAWKARAAADPNGFGKWLGKHLAQEVAPRELGPAVTPSKVDARRDYLGSIKRDSTPKPRDYSAYTAEEIGKMPDATFAGLLDSNLRFRERVKQLEQTKALPSGFVETKYSAGHRRSR